MQKHRPKTNALWVHYFADNFLNSKKLGLIAAELRRLRRFCRASLGYASATAAVWDELFEDLLVSGEEAA